MPPGVLAVTYSTETGNWYFQKLGGDQLGVGAINSPDLITDGLFAGATGLGKFADGFLSGSAALAKFGDGLFTADATGRGKFADGFLVSGKIAAGALGGGLIRDGDILSGKYASQSIRTADLGLGQVVSSIIAASAVGDGHIVDLAATKLTGLIPPARISGLPYSNLYLTNSIVDGDLLSGITAQKLLSGYFGFKVASGYPSVGLTGFVLPARISGLPYANLSLSGQILGTDVSWGAITSGKLASGFPLNNLLFDNQSFTNLLFNGNFEVGDPPKGWAVWGVGFTRARSTEQVKIGSYSIKCTRAGEDGAAEQSITDWARYQGRLVTLGCWVYATVSGAALVYLADGTQDKLSDYHPGDSTWKWLTKSMQVAAIASGVLAELCIKNVSGAVGYYDGATLVEGTVCPAFTPRPLDYQSVISGYLGSGQIGSDHIRPGSIISSLVATGAIGGMHIADLNILSGKYAALSIQGADINWGALTSGKYASQSIRTTDLGLGQVVSSIIGANIIATPHILAGGILSASIGANMLATPHIVNQGILSASIGAAAIGTAHVANAAIVSALVASGVIGGGHVANLAIGTGHLGLNAVVSGKLGSGAIPDGSVSEAQLTPGISIDIAETISEPTGIAAEPISGHSCILFLSGFSGKRIGVARAADSNRMPAVGKIGANAIVSGGVMTTNPILSYGKQTSPISGYVQRLVYVGTSGQPTVTVPSASGNCVQILGQVMDTDGTMFLFPQPFFVQVAA